MAEATRININEQERKILQFLADEHGDFGCEMAGSGYGSTKAGVEFIYGQRSAASPDRTAPSSQPAKL